MELVNHPSHYNMGEVEVIDIIEGLIKDIDDGALGFNVGSSLKYILRSPYKENMCRDLNKAVWHLQRAIKIFEDNYDFELQDVIEDDIEDIQTTFNDDITNIGFELEEEENNGEV